MFEVLKYIHNNITQRLELVFGNGCSMMYPDHRIGLSLGPLDKFTSFDKLYDAVKQQIYHLLDMSCDTVKKARDNSAHLCLRAIKIYP